MTFTCVRHIWKALHRQFPAGCWSDGTFTVSVFIAKRQTEYQKQSRLTIAYETASFSLKTI